MHSVLPGMFCGFLYASSDGKFISNKEAFMKERNAYLKDTGLYGGMISTEKAKVRFSLTSAHYQN